MKKRLSRRINAALRNAHLDGPDKKSARQLIDKTLAALDAKSDDSAGPGDAGVIDYGFWDNKPKDEKYMFARGDRIVAQIYSQEKDDDPSEDKDL